MNWLHTILFGILICCVVVSARQYGVRPTDEQDQDDYANTKEDNVRKHAPEQMRHRRKRWEMRYGYDYPVPPQPFHYGNDRRDSFEQRPQEYLSQIFRLLDEISAYVRRPAPVLPPQPIYVPYPVQVQVPFCNCPSANLPPNKRVNVTSRFPEMEDSNQNWGFVDEKEPKQTGRDVDDYDDDFKRPISLTPVRPHGPLSRKQPDVNHGSSQAADISTHGPRLSKSQGRVTSQVPAACNAVILSCCRPTDTRAEQFKCFTELGCQSTFSGGVACEKQSISAVLEAFTNAYSPNN